MDRNWPIRPQPCSGHPIQGSDVALDREVPMSGQTTTVLIVVVIVVIAILAFVTIRTRRQRLQQRFGAEYDRVAAEQNSKFRADAQLTQRERRVRKLDATERISQASLHSGVDPHSGTVR
jgi:hypothetical protein